MSVPGNGKVPVFFTRKAVPADSNSIAKIYNQGIEDRIATFETASRTGDDIRKWFGAPGKLYD
ncbi:MAG: GNAT family N-acetyltransferase [Thermoplasmataceae archaeon]